MIDTKGQDPHEEAKQGDQAVMPPWDGDRKFWLLKSLFRRPRCVAMVGTPLIHPLLTGKPQPKLAQDREAVASVNAKLAETLETMVESLRRR